MTCDQIEAELVAYQFAVVDDHARTRIEQHLGGCASCVRAFLETKRAIETSEGAPRPRPEVRDRLRRAVANELGLERGWSWWERPLAIAIAASLVLVAGGAMRAATSAPGGPPHALSQRP